MVEAGKARAQALGWPDAYAYTKALGRAGPARQTRRRPRHHRPALDHRVGAGRAGPGLDPRLPHGRAGHHLLRAGPAQGVPRRARRRHRRHPGRPGGGRHPRRGRRRARADGPGPDPSTTWPPGSGTRSATDGWSSWSRTGSPRTRSTTPTASRSWCRNGRFPGGAGCSGSCSGPPRPCRGRAGRQDAARPRASRRLLAALEERHQQAERALGYVELYGAYTETEAAFRVDRLLALWDRLDAEDQAEFCFDPAAIDWDHLRPRRPPAVGGRPRPGAHHARSRSPPPGREPTGRRKAVLSPERQMAAFDLENTLIASNVVESYAWLATRHLAAGERVGFVPTWSARPRRCWPSTGGTGATSSATSTAATRGPRPSGCATTHGSSSATCC